MLPTRTRLRSVLLLIVAVLLTSVSAAQAQESAYTYNANPFKPTNGAVPYECIPATGGSGATVRSYFFSDAASAYSWRNLAWSQPADPDDAPACAAGMLRVARWERFNVAGETAYIMRGGGGSNTAEAYGNSGIRFGHVRYPSGISKNSSVLTAYIPGRVGQAPASCNGTLYNNKPERGTTSELSALFYKPSQASSSGAKWDNYGDQAGTGPDRYNYLLWTWPALPIADGGGRNAGGGQIRAVIRSGQNIRTCDVNPVYLPMYRANATQPAGQVKMLYGRINNASTTVHGWFGHAWQLNGQGWNYFVETASAPPPPPPPPPGARSTLNQGDTLQPGESLTSDNGAYRLTMQPDGNLVEYRQSDGAVLWHSNTYGQTGAYLIMQQDGNLVMYRNGAPVWHTNTLGNPGSRLVLQSDSNLVIYNSAGTPIWHIW